MLFDRFIAVDWSAANAPRLGANAIWIAETGRSSCNLPTRHAAMTHLRTRLRAALAAGERLLVGCDFSFGFPLGAAERLAGSADWRALWARLAAAIIDGPDNRSNRFDVASAFNVRLGQPLFCGHPVGRSYPALAPRRTPAAYAEIAEKRLAERLTRAAQPVWKLMGAGSVGSQTLLGIAHLEALRQDAELGPAIAVWPFETGFTGPFVRPITLCEIYPSMFPLAADTEPRDRAQVEAVVAGFAALNRADALGALLAPPLLDSATTNGLLSEEGWIAGVGREAMLVGRLAA